MENIIDTTRTYLLSGAIPKGYTSSDMWFCAHWFGELLGSKNKTCKVFEEKSANFFKERGFKVTPCSLIGWEVSAK